MKPAAETPAPPPREASWFDIHAMFASLFCQPCTHGPAGAADVVDLRKVRDPDPNEMQQSLVKYFNEHKAEYPNLGSAVAFATAHEGGLERKAYGI